MSDGAWAGLVFALFGLLVLVACVHITLSVRLNAVRMRALNSRPDSLVITGFSGYQTDQALKRIARLRGELPRRTGQRFTVVVDETVMTWWRGSTHPELICRLPLDRIRELRVGATSTFGRTSYPTIFIGIDVASTTFDLELRVAGVRGVTYASREIIGAYAKDLEVRARRAGGMGGAVSPWKG